MRTDTPLEAVLKRDRLLVLAGIIGVATLAWAYTVYVASSIGAAPGTAMAMPNMQSWSAAHWAAMFVMWMVMMIAMMVPSAAPMILMFATINRQRREKQQPYVPTGVFLLGYAVVWSGFAAGATIGNWGLHTHAMLSSMMGSSTNALLGGVLLVAAGAFQWTRLKYACLTNCRSPLGFIMSEWRDGVGGALKMGLRHGVYCLGCCWILMALLFVLGVMNLVWIAALAAFVLLEKITPKGQLLGRAAGVLLMVWGGLMLAGVLA
jgi:predicted metal-binding membrane protein